MSQTILGIVLIIIGFCFLIFYKKFARYAVKSYDSLRWPHASEKFIRFSRLLGGILLIIIGILALLRIINF